jgi:hypothetical protein
MPPILGALAAAGAATIATASTALAGVWSFLQGGGILASILKIGFSMAAQYVLGQLFSPKPTAQASKLETTYGDKRPREVILGRVGIAGHHVFRNAYGRGNREVIDVFRLSDFRISAIPRVLGQGLWRAVETDHDTILGGDVTIRKHYGTDTLVDSWLLDRSSGRWKSTSVGLGISYAVVNTHLDIDDLTSPWDPLFEVYGPNLYDWRSDDTAGGDGDDRWNDPSTWTGDPENPVLQMYLLERGVFVNGQLIVGKGINPVRLPLAEWTVAANICDELISTDAGFVPRYRSSIIAVSGEGATHDSNMQPLFEACAASWVEDASGEFPIVGAPQAIVATFTDDDLITNEGLRFSAKRRRVELVNTVAGSYIDPGVFYEETAIATKIDDGALIVDGETLAVSLPFNAVTYSEQADRLADIQIRASRYQANAEVCLRPKFLALKPGRWVTWNSARYGERDFLVVSKRLGALDGGGPRNVHLVLQEIGAGVFDPTAYETVPTAPLPPGTPDYASEVDNIVVQPWVLTSEAAGEIPSIRVAFDAIDDPTITSVEFEYWPTAQPLEVQHASLPMPASSIYLTTGVISSTEYQVRYRLRAEPSRSIPWVGPYAVTTPAAAATDITVKLANLSPGVRAELQNLLAMQALLTAKLNQLAAAVTEEVGQAVDSRSVAVRYQNATAAAMSTLSAEITALDGALTAVAASTTSLLATVGDTGAGALWRMVVQAGTGDVVSRIVLQVRATVGDDWVAASTVWEAGFVGGDPGDPFGRIVLSAAQTMIADGMGDVIALFDEDGVHLSNAFIANLTGDQISFNTLTGDHIVVASIDSPSLAFEAVTEFADISYLEDHSGTYDSGGLVERLSVLVDNPAGTPMLEIIYLELTNFKSGGGTGTNSRIDLKRDGVLQASVVRNDAEGNGTESASLTQYNNSGATSIEYTIEVAISQLSSGNPATTQVLSESGVLFWKR